jgi:hypothetical protein
VFYNEAQLPGRQLVAHETSAEVSHKPVSGQAIDVDSSVATSAFTGTDLQYVAQAALDECIGLFSSLGSRGFQS